MNRSSSKISDLKFLGFEDDCNNISISTEPELSGEEEEKNPFDEDFVIEQFLINENKKMRMYSL